MSQLIMDWRDPLEAQRYQEHQIIAGVDEVGRGCIAGPICAAAAIVDYNAIAALSPKERERHIRDSKKLSEKRREAAREILLTQITTRWGVAFATEREIETYGIVKANHLAMMRALSSIPGKEPYRWVLVDGREHIPSLPVGQDSIIKGDDRCYAIAAASILAKTTRDRYMQEQELRHPGYGFAKHVGYGTREHITQLKSKGPCPLHRRNFQPIASMVEPLQETTPL